MVTRAYFARRFLALKLLRGALVAGALYDAALALLLLGRPGLAAGLLGPGPGGAAAGGLAAVWSAMLAALGIAAARDVRRYSAVIAALICGRTAAAVVLATGAVTAGTHLPWSVAWNALLAVILAATWWPQRG